MDHLLFGVEWKAGNSGELEGYMSVFNNVDQEGDVVLPGAFKKTFADWSAAKSKMPLIDQHQLSSDGVIGSVTHMAEDGYGAKIRAKFSSIQKAQDIRLKMIEGHLNGLSYTYEAIRSHRGTFGGKSVRFLDEVKAYEATVSPFPVNQLALASAKAKDPKKPYGDVPYADPGYQSDGIYRYPLTADKVMAAWSYIHQADNRKPYTAEQLSAIEARIRAAMKKFGHQVTEAASLDFLQFAAAAKSLLDTAVPAEVQKAAMGLLLPMYDPTDTDAAGLADGQPTADAAATTGDEPAESTAEPDAAAYAVSIIAPPGPRDDAPAGDADASAYPAQVLESMRIQADLDAREAEINQALGRNDA